MISSAIAEGTRVGIVVLAAGASTRMGEAKQLLRYKGETLVRHATNAALASRCRPVIVVGGGESVGAVRDEVAETGASLVVNETWAEGMSSSIRCGVAALEAATAGRAEALVLMLCDQPFVTGQVINRLLETYDARRLRSPPLLVASTYESQGEQTRGVPALFSRLLFSELLALRGVAGAKRIIEQYSKEAVLVAVPEAAFDVDTPDDYRVLQIRR